MSPFHFRTANPVGIVAVRMGLFFLLYTSFWQFIDGFVYQKLGIGISTAINLMFILAGLSVVFLHPKDWFIRRYFILLLLILVFLLIKNLNMDVNVSKIMLDIQFMLRGVVVMIVTATLFYFLPTKKGTNFFFKYSKFQFWFVCSMVFIHFSFGFGGVELQNSDRLRDSYSSFFRHGNQMTALLAASWWVLFSGSQSLMERMLLTSVVVVTSLLMGSKTAVLLVMLMVFVSFTLWTLKKNKFVFILWISMCFISLSLTVLYVGDVLVFIANQFVQYSSEGEKMLRRIESADVLTALLSGRNEYAEYASLCISEASTIEMIIGIGVQDYTACLGAEVRVLDNRFAENDVIDMFGSYGLVGLLLTYVVVVFVTTLYFFRRYGVRNLLSYIGERQEVMIGILGSLVIYLLFSIMSGHVFMYPIASSAVGISLGIMMNHIKECYSFKGFKYINF